MEELIRVVSGFFNQGIEQGSLNSIITIFIGLILIAVVSYFVYRLAIFGLKLGTIGLLIYLILSFTNIISLDRETNQNQVTTAGKLDLISLKKQISSFLNEQNPKASSIFLLKEILNNKL